MATLNTQTSLVSSLMPQERRGNQRTDMALPVLARSLDPAYKEEVQITSNTSRNGLYFKTRSKHYSVGMCVSVIMGYAPNHRVNSEAFGQVVRVDRLEDGSFGIAIEILMR